MDAALRAHLTRLLSAEADIDAAWLVGLHARGRARADSDDVAVLFAAAAARDELEVALRRGRLVDDVRAGLRQRVDEIDVERVAPITFGLVMRDALLLVRPGQRPPAAPRRHPEPLSGGRREVPSRHPAHRRALHTIHPQADALRAHRQVERSHHRPRGGPNRRYGTAATPVAGSGPEGAPQYGAQSHGLA